jgi:hypothetical protein
VDVDGERVDLISGYVGTTRLFERAGFERALRTTGRSGGRPRWVMRRELPRPSAGHAAGTPGSGHA